MTDLRKQLLVRASHTVDIRKSRFLAQAVPLPSPDQAPALLAELSVPEASHNCWAWRFDGQYRFSDDGEPGGTAGRPILAAIEHQNFDRTLVVVARWYGGIQLGTGGLARAYGGCAVACLQDAASEPLIERITMECVCPYPLLERFKLLLAAAGGSIATEDFLATGVQLCIAVPLEQEASLQQALLDLSRGEAQLLRRTGCRASS